MGYEHYWIIDPAVLAGHPLAPTVIADMEEIAAESPVPVDTTRRQLRNAFELNGVGEDGAGEAFTWPPRKKDGRDSCKTNQRPYDVAVTACLAAAKHRLGDALVILSNGDVSDWAAGCELASEVLGEDVAVPIKSANHYVERAETMTENPKRWVRFDFSIAGISGQEWVIVRAPSSEGAIAMAGMVFGMHMLDLARGEGWRMDPFSIVLKWVEVSHPFERGHKFETPQWQSLQRVLREAKRLQGGAGVVISGGAGAR